MQQEILNLLETSQPEGGARRPADGLGRDAFGIVECSCRPGSREPRAALGVGASHQRHRRRGPSPGLWPPVALSGRRPVFVAPTGQTLVLFAGQSQSTASLEPAESRIGPRLGAGQSLDGGAFSELNLAPARGFAEEQAVGKGGELSDNTGHCHRGIRWVALATEERRGIWMVSLVPCGWVGMRCS